MNRHPRTGIPNLFHQACTFTHSQNESAPHLPMRVLLQESFTEKPKESAKGFI